MGFLAKREEWVVEFKGPETTNETKERMKTGSELGLRMVGDSGKRSERGKEKSETTRSSVEERQWLSVVAVHKGKSLTKEEVQVPILETL